MKSRGQMKPRSRGRGASATRIRPDEPDISGQIKAGIGRVPWSKLALHLGIFGFWLALLSGFSYGVSWMDRPIDKIEVSGDLRYVERADIEEGLAKGLEQGFFTIDLDAIRDQLVQQPWVKTVAVSRQWPGTLKVQLIEQVAVVRWNQKGLMNANGEVFEPAEDRLQDLLPQLNGPENKADEVFQQYQQWQEQMQLIGLSIASLSMESRGAWRIGFTDGWELNLGKQDVAERLQRFRSIYAKKLRYEKERIAVVDARYTRGVAVTWKDGIVPESS